MLVLSNFVSLVCLSVNRRKSKNLKNKMRNHECRIMLETMKITNNKNNKNTHTHTQEPSIAPTVISLFVVLFSCTFSKA